MEMSEMEMSLPGACKLYFGLKEGQALMDFHKEYQQLTDKDKEELKAELIKAGYKIK